MTKADRVKLRKNKPSVWVPVEPGDRIAGTVVEISAAWSDQQYDGKDPESGFYPLLRVEVKDTTPGYEIGQVLAVHGFAAVLRSRILDMQPAPGEDVVIGYEGTGEAKTGRSAPELFRLTVPGRDPREAAANVYAKLSGSSRKTAPEPETEDIPF